MQRSKKDNVPYCCFSHAMVVLGRMHRIAAHLQLGQWINSAHIASAEEVSDKTVYRCMDFFRDVLFWDIESGNKGYRLIHKNQDLIQPNHKPHAPRPQPNRI